MTIGNKTQIGPGVQILTADHPRNPAVRAQGPAFGRPVTIGDNVWNGAGAIILPGVATCPYGLVPFVALTPSTGRRSYPPRTADQGNCQ